MHHGSLDRRGAAGDDTGGSATEQATIPEQSDAFLTY